MKEVIFLWSIENISYSWHEKGEEIVSPKFYADSIQSTAWSLHLYPKGHHNSDYMSLYLRREDEHPIAISVNFELSCMSGDMSVVHSCTFPEKFKIFQSYLSTGFGESRFIKRYEVFERRKDLYLTQDILTLRCRMWKEEGEEFQQIFGRSRLVTEQILSVGGINPENGTEKTFEIHSETLRKQLFTVTVTYFEDKIDVEIYPMNREHMKYSTCKLSVLDKNTSRKLCEHISYFCGEPHREFWQLHFSDPVSHTKNDPSDDNYEFMTECVYSSGEIDNYLEQNHTPKSTKLVSEYISSGKPADLCGDLWRLYVEQILCDVELKTRKKSFFVHKCVLCARSPVFSAMLTGNMKEKKSRCVEIEDISNDILELLIDFLYTDVLKDLQWNEAVELYYATDKYRIERLKMLCCFYLMENVDIGNICESLILADRHHDPYLKQKVVDFIRNNEDELFRSFTWKKFAREHQQLAAEVMLSKYEETENQRTDDLPEAEFSNIRRIQEDFLSLYQNHVASDVVIKTKEAMFPVHKAVLSASSSTFYDEFTNDLNDKASAIVFEMKDWESDVVSRMLSFLYTDTLKDIQWDIAVKLYQIAQAYQIPRLQVKCSCFLLENLKVSNASSLLLLSHEYNNVHLKSVVVEFICMYDEEIFGSDEWIEFCKTNLLLANETMLAKYNKR